MLLLFISTNISILILFWMISLTLCLRNSIIKSSNYRVGRQIGLKKQAAILWNLFSIEKTISSLSSREMWLKSSVNWDGIELTLLFSNRMVPIKFVNYGSKISRLLNIVIWISIVLKLYCWTGMTKISVK